MFISVNGKIGVCSWFCDMSFHLEPQFQRMKLSENLLYNKRITFQGRNEALSFCTCWIVSVCVGYPHKNVQMTTGCLHCILITGIELVPLCHADTYERTMHPEEGSGPGGSVSLLPDWCWSCTNMSTVSSALSKIEGIIPLLLCCFSGKCWKDIVCLLSD